MTEYPETFKMSGMMECLETFKSFKIGFKKGI